jgi:hypothetical protein
MLACVVVVQLRRLAPCCLYFVIYFIKQIAPRRARPQTLVVLNIVCFVFARGLPPCPLGRLIKTPTVGSPASENGSADQLIRATTVGSVFLRGEVDALQPSFSSEPHALDNSARMPVSGGRKKEERRVPSLPLVTTPPLTFLSGCAGFPETERPWTGGRLPVRTMPSPKCI